MIYLKVFSLEKDNIMPRNLLFSEHNFHSATDAVAWHAKSNKNENYEQSEGMRRYFAAVPAQRTFIKELKLRFSFALPFSFLFYRAAI